MSIEHLDDILIKPSDLRYLRVGHILDAQDYLEQWYLSIVVDSQDDGGSSVSSLDTVARRKIHFLPFVKNSKRDEIFTTIDSQHKIAPAFTNSEKIEDQAKAIISLREYLKQY